MVFSSLVWAVLISPLLIFMWLFSTLNGQFILERESSCSDGTSVYSCTTNTSFFITWRFPPSTDRQIIANGDMSPQTVLVGSSTVLFTIIASSSSSISVTATISYSDAVGLNGTGIQCNTEDVLTINVPDLTTNLPASLKIFPKENGIMLDPTPNIIGIPYNVRSANITIINGILNGSAILIPEFSAAFNVSFICIETSNTFSIGECIFQDYIENLTYILFPNKYWKIKCFNDSNEIFDIICMADGNWNESYPCLVSSTTDEITDNSIYPTTTTTWSKSCPETSGGCENMIAYVVAPLVAIFLALLGNILVIGICFTKNKKKNMENINNIKLSNTSTRKDNNDTQQRCAINLMDNVAYDYITAK